MKPKLYLETTVIGYLTSRISIDSVIGANQTLTRRWWQDRRKLDEAGAGDVDEAMKRLRQLQGIPVLRMTADAHGLAAMLLKRKALPTKARMDAFHLAIASTAKMDYLLTWNFRHLANASLRSLMESVCKKAGCRFPVICTPQELMEVPQWRMKS